MRRLREHTAALQQQAKLPGRPPEHALFFVDNDGVEQPAPADKFDERRADRADAFAELLPQHLSPMCEIFFD